MACVQHPATITFLCQLNTLMGMRGYFDPACPKVISDVEPFYQDMVLDTPYFIRSLGLKDIGS